MRTKKTGVSARHAAPAERKNLENSRDGNGIVAMPARGPFKTSHSHHGNGVLS